MQILRNIAIRREILSWNFSNFKETYFKLQQNPLYLNDIRNNISVWLFLKNSVKNIFHVYSHQKGYILNMTDFNVIDFGIYAERIQHLEAKKATVEFCNFFRPQRHNTGPFFMENITEAKAIIENIKKFPMFKEENSKNGFMNLLLKLEKDNNNATQHALSKTTNLTKNEIRKKEIKNQTKISIAEPTHIFIELTQNCNLACRMCGRPPEKFSPHREMDFELFKKIGKKLFKKGAFIDLRGYGESTYYSKFPEVIDFCKNFDCDFGIVTNLTTQNKNVLKKMIEAGFWIQISFDGATKKTFEYIRRRSKFENVLKSLKFITDYKKEINSKSKIEFIVTIQGNNIHELMDICKIAVEHNLDRVVFNAVVTNENDTNNLKFHKNAVKKNVPRAITYVKKNGIEAQIISSFGISELEKNMKIMDKCPRPWSWIYVDFTGKMGPCNHFMEQDYTFGNLTLNNFDYIVEKNNLAFQFLRSAINTKYRLSSCEYCFKRRYDY